MKLGFIAATVAALIAFQLRQRSNDNSAHRDNGAPGVAAKNPDNHQDEAG